MQFVFRSVLTAVFLAMASVADAGPFEDGEAAYQRHDYTTALQVWRALADQGDALAQNALGVLYAQGQGVTQDYAEAVKWYSKAADQELAIAQCNLADMYRQGQGVTQDYAEAASWYELAAKQGHARAEYRLGLMYSQGQGVPKDDARAMRWFRLAADQGNADAQAKLAPAPPQATPNHSTNQPSDRPSLGCARTGVPGLSFRHLEYMTEIISMMNCGQPFNRYTVDDFMCDPMFKGLSWHQARMVARMTSIAKCGQLPVNSMPD
jgi:hypothetical protein